MRAHARARGAARACATPTADVSPDGATILVRAGGAPRRRRGGDQHDRAPGRPRDRPIPEVVVERPRLRGRPPLAARRRRLLLAGVGPPRHAVGRGAPRGRRGRRRARSWPAADRRESICQPTWAPDGSLWFSADRTGFWSLYRWTPADGVEPMVDLGNDIGFPQWVFGQSLLRPPRRRARGARRQRRRAWTASPCGSRTGSVTDARRRRHVDRRAAGAAGPTLVYIAAVANDRAARRPASLDGDAAGAVEVLVPPRDLGLDAGWFSAPEAIDFPTGGRRRPRTRSTTRRPTRTSSGPDGRAAAAARDDPRRAHRRGPADAAAWRSSTGRAGASPWSTSTTAARPGTAGPTATCSRASGAWPTSRTAWPSCDYLAERGDVDPDRLLHPRRLGRRLHHPGRPRLPRRVRGGRQPLRRGRPRRAGRRHPQVREPLPRRAGRAVARGRAPSTRRARRSSTPTASTGRWSCSRASTTRSCRPNQAEMIVDAVRAKGVPGRLPGLRGRAARLPPGRQHPGRPRRRAAASTPRSSASPSPRTRASRRSRREPHTGVRSTRPRITGVGSTGVGRDLDGSLERGEGAREPGGVVEVELEERLAARHRRRRRWRATPRRRSATRRPPCGPDRRRAARPPRRPPCASSRLSVPVGRRGDDLDVGGAGQRRRRDRRPAPAPSPATTSMARPSASASAGSMPIEADEREHLPGQREGELDDVARDRRRPAPRPTRPPRARCRPCVRGARPSG